MVIFMVNVKSMVMVTGVMVKCMVKIMVKCMVKIMVEWT